MHASNANVNDVQEKLQHDVDKINIWCTNNNMAINPVKTNSMLIGSKQKLKSAPVLDINIENKKIQRVKSQKLLGIYIDENLKWNIQVQNVCKLIQNKKALLKRISYFLTAEMKELFYNSYILSCFDYGCIVWSNCSKTDFEKLNKLQKRAAKIILKKSIKTPYLYLFKELNWITFKNRCEYHMALIVFKAINNLNPTYISNLLIFTNNESYKLRSSTRNDLVHRPCNSNYDKNSFLYSTMKIWNNLPMFIRQCTNVNSFKRNLKKISFRHADLCNLLHCIIFIMFLMLFLKVIL